jgi:hypothetical protein
MRPWVRGAAACVLQASSFRSDVSVFHLNQTCGAGTAVHPAFRRNTAERAYTIEAAHNPDVAGSNPAPAMTLRKTLLIAGFFFVRGWGDAMNPRQMRGDELQDCFGLLAPQPLVESGARDRLVDGGDDLELFVVLMFRQMRLLMSESFCHGRDPPR